MNCYIIIGGVAAGATAAARLRRLDENAKIILFERGEYISFANCGLPYHIGKVIPERDELLVMTPESFHKRFNVEVKNNTEVIEISPEQHRITARNSSGNLDFYNYDKLLIASGSSPLQENLPGYDTDKICHLWTMADMDRIIERLNDSVKNVVVIGGGYIGLEAAENLRLRNLNVTIVGRGKKILPPFDIEMAAYLEQELLDSGIALELGRQVTGFEFSGDKKFYNVLLRDGTKLEADLVIMCVGVVPNSHLAQAAGLKLGEHGHIAVNEHLMTSESDIYAAGDVIEVFDPVSGGTCAIALAGPANKQGRIAADNMTGGTVSYRGTLGSAVIKVGGLTAGCVGYSEERLRKAGMEYRKIYTHHNSNASY
ncbi:MAG: FAD-dependent oxidoreductase, partial [Victivallaceae bacterium]